MDCESIAFLYTTLDLLQNPSVHIIYAFGLLLATNRCKKISGKEASDTKPYIILT